METRSRRLLGQGLMVLVALGALPLSLELLLFGAVRFTETFPSVLSSLLLLLLGLALYLCLRGSTMESRRAVWFVSRALLLHLSFAAGLLSVELIYQGVIALAVTRGRALAGLDFEGLALIGGLVLVSLCALGIKYTLGLRYRYWILLLAVFATVIVTVIVAAGGIVLGLLG